jgi:hypothetical protein
MNQGVTTKNTKKNKEVENGNAEKSRGINGNFREPKAFVFLNSVALRSPREAEIGQSPNSVNSVNSV